MTYMTDIVTFIVNDDKVISTIPVVCHFQMVKSYNI